MLDTIGLDRSLGRVYADLAVSRRSGVSLRRTCSRGTPGGAPTQHSQLSLKQRSIRSDLLFIFFRSYKAEYVPFNWHEQLDQVDWGWPHRGVESNVESRLKPVFTGNEIKTRGGPTEGAPVYSVTLSSDGRSWDDVHGKADPAKSEVRRSMRHAPAPRPRPFLGCRPSSPSHSPTLRSPYSQQLTGYPP
jgi:hypothetical protein